MQSFIAVTRVLLSLAFVVFLAYYSIRLVLPRLQAGSASSRGTMCLIERIPVGMRGYICLVMVGRQYFLVGVSAAGIRLLAEIPPESLPAQEAQMPGYPDFAEVLRKSSTQARGYWRTIRRRLVRNNIQERGPEDEQE